ncbi:unnamed protein product, partial [marine sediment metagenome]
TDKTPRKATVEMRQNTASFNSIVYNTSKTVYAFVRKEKVAAVGAPVRVGW